MMDTSHSKSSRWLDQMPSQASMPPLLELITKHQFIIQAEQDELAAGRQGDR